MLSGNRGALGRTDRGRRRSSATWFALGLTSSAVACLVSACDTELIVGSWSRPPDTAGSAGFGGTETGGQGAGGIAGSSGMGGAGFGGSSAGVSGAGSGGDTAGDGAGGEAGNGAGGAAGGETGGAGGEGACGVTAPERPVTAPIAVPWQTSFENGICDYLEADGFCYMDGDASYSVVSSPAHSGNSAAAFTVNSSTASAHARCAREGTFPADAVYGAWFYVSALANEPALWNLFLFQGHNGVMLEPLWDVSIGTSDAGQSLFLFDHRAREVLSAPDAPGIPIGVWFHVEFRLRRAADQSGMVALYQDGVLVLQTMRSTDDTSWGQWYVGNLAEGRSPPDSTVYVDDVSIRAAP